MSKKKLLIDCDPGHDDAIMLLISCFQDEYEIIGVSSCSGNQTIEKTSLNASNLLNYFGRDDIPLSIGSSTPIIRKPRICAEIHGETGLDGFDFPSYNHKYEKIPACDFLIEKLLANEEVTIITSGPMTNLGLAIRKNKEILKHIKEIVLMGGSTGEGNMNKYAEFNILVDPEAADICFSSGVPIRMLGLNVTRKILVNDSVMSEASKIKTKGGDLFIKLMTVFNKNQRDFFGLEAGPLHDPATIISLLNENVFTFEPMNVTIDTSASEKAGQTVCKKNKPHNCLVAFEVNIKLYWQEIYKYLQKLN